MNTIQNTNQIKITMEAFGLTESFTITPGEFFNKKIINEKNDQKRFNIMKDVILKIEKKNKTNLENRPSKRFNQINPLNGQIEDTGTIEHFERKGYFRQGIYRCVKHGHVTYNNKVWKEVTE